MISLSPIAKGARVRRILGEQSLFSYRMKNTRMDLDVAEDFVQANTNYFRRGAARDQPRLVQQSRYFAINIDISQMYPTMDHKFDGNDWSLIHKTKQIATPTPNTSATLAPTTTS